MKSFEDIKYDAERDFDKIWQLIATYDNLWQLMAIFDI